MTADDTLYGCKYLRADGTEMADVSVLRPNGIYISTGDTGFIGTDSAGQLMFIPATSEPRMVIAQADMVADDVAYNCKFLEADGTEGAVISLRRPNGINIDWDDTGFIGQDSSGQSIFIPCHARKDEDLGLTIQVTAADPAGLELGQIWFRADL